MARSSDDRLPAARKRFGQHFLRDAQVLDAIADALGDVSQSTVVEIVAADLDRSLAFYRLLGLTVPDPDGPHVEVTLPGGNRLAFDTEDVIAGVHPDWTPPSGPGR